MASGLTPTATRLRTISATTTGEAMMPGAPEPPVRDTDRAFRAGRPVDKVKQPDTSGSYGRGRRERRGPRRPSAETCGDASLSIITEGPLWGRPPGLQRVSRPAQRGSNRLGRNRHRLAGILDDLVRLRGLADSHAVAFTHKNHAEGARFQHAGEPSLPLADGQAAGGIVPLDRDGGIHALLVIVVIALVFVEREAASRAAIDAQFDGVRRLLGGIFDIGPHGHDGSRAYIQRQAVERSRRVDGSPAIDGVTGPKVVPFRLRQV